MDNMTGSEELVEVGTSGPPPKSRVKDAMSAHSIVNEMVRISPARQSAWAEQKGMLDGNSPYDEQKLIAGGQAYRSNFPSLEGRAMVSSALTPYYELLSSGRNILNVALDIDNEQARTTWSQIATEEADRRLKEEPNYNTALWQMLYDMVAFGRGHLLFDNPIDWKFHRVEFDRVMFPDGTNADTRLWDYFVILQSVPVLWLWERIHQPGGNWDEKAVRDSIMMAAPTRPEGGPYPDWMAVQRMLNDNDVWFSSASKRVRIASLYVKEYSKKWSEYVINRDLTSAWDANPGERGAPPNFMFKRINGWDSVDDFLGTFVLEPREGSINGMSGLAKDIYQQMKVKDRLQNALVDNGFLRCALIMQATDASGYEDASVVMLGNQILVPPGVNIQNSQVIGDVETALGVIRDMDMRLQNNTGIYRPQIVQASGNPRTATEAEFHFAQATALTSSQMNRFYDQADIFAKSLYVRMAKNDSVFRGRCVKRGIPESDLVKVRRVGVERTIGSGSVSNRRNVLQELLPIGGYYPEAGFQNLIADVTRSFTDEYHTKRYMPELVQGTAESFDEWAATQENAALKIGAPVVRTPQQNDYTHSVIHLGAGQAAVETVQQGAPPIEVAGFIENILRHVITAHLPPLQKSRPNEAKKVEASVKELNDILSQINAAIQKQQQQASRQQSAEQQLTVDQQLAAKKAEGDLQVKTAKAQLDGKLKTAKAAQSMEINEAEADQRIQLAKREAEAKREAMLGKTRQGNAMGVWK